MREGELERRGRARRRLRALLVIPAVIAGATLLAFAASGGLDTTFGTGGMAVTPASGPLRDAAIDSQGRIVAGGTHYTGPGGTMYEWWIRRYNPDGSNDTGFGTAGLVSLFGGVDAATVENVTVDANDRPVAVGASFVVSGSGKRLTATSYATIVRLNGDGTLDTTFGSGGVVRATVPGANPGSGAYGVALQPDGKILVSGRAIFTSKSQTHAYPFVARYLTDGSLDTGFGSGGFAIDKRATQDGAARFTRVAVQSTGGIVLSRRSDAATWVVSRFLSNGAIDTAFGLLTSTEDTVCGIAVDPSDRIVATGWRTISSTLADVVVVRYSASGALDASFGASGAATLHLYDYQQGLTDPAFQTSDGKILVGVALYPTGKLGPIAGSTIRFLPDGSLDTTYGFGGVSDTVTVGANVNTPYGLVLSPDGTGVIAACWCGDWVLARYHTQD